MGVALGIAGTAVAAFALLAVRNRESVDPSSSLQYTQESALPADLEFLFEGFEARLELYSEWKPRRSPSHLPRFYLVIDDVGYNLDSVQSLLSVGPDITFAVLPHGPVHVVAARLVADRGASVFLHMPMEARQTSKNNEKPILLTAMNDRELTDTLSMAMSEFDVLHGVSNHMGSRFTENPHKVRPALKVLARRGVMFLDSVTSPRSVAYDNARELGIPAAARDVFLDADRTPTGVGRAWNLALRVAEISGAAVAIYHPHPATLDTVTRLIRESTHRVTFHALTKDTL